MTNINSLKRRGMVAMAVLALILGVASTGWMLAVVNQWALPWTTFRIFLPDAGYMERQQDMRSPAPVTDPAPAPAPAPASAPIDAAN